MDDTVDWRFFCSPGGDNGNTIMHRDFVISIRWSKGRTIIPDGVASKMDKLDAESKRCAVVVAVGLGTMIPTSKVNKK